jgi:chemotaxis protein histidine kinase CheA
MSDSARIIRPNLTLNSKVTVGGPGAVDEAMLEKAEQVIQNMSEDYLKWVKDDLARLAKAFAVLKSAGGRGPDTAAQLEAIFAVAHDIKGQGGSFDYQLMTTVGNQLCRFIEALKGEAEVADIEVIELHVNALQAVMAQKLKGDGGAIGKKFLAGLEQVIAKRAKPDA